jgi:hypothetical protein
MAKRQMSMLSFIPDHIKKSKVEENQSHHAYDRDDKRKIKSEWFSQFQWLQHKNLMFFRQVCIDGKKTNIFTRGKLSEKPKNHDFTKHESTGTRTFLNDTMISISISPEIV